MLIFKSLEDSNNPDHLDEQIKQDVKKGSGRTKRNLIVKEKNKKNKKQNILRLPSDKEKNNFKSNVNDFFEYVKTLLDKNQVNSLTITVDVGFKNLSISFEELKINLGISFVSKNTFTNLLPFFFQTLNRSISPYVASIFFMIETQHVMNNSKMEYFISGMASQVNSNVQVSSINSSIKKHNAKQFNFDYKKIRTFKDFKNIIVINKKFYDFLTNGWSFNKLTVDEFTSSGDINFIGPSFADYIDTRLLRPFTSSL